MILAALALLIAVPSFYLMMGPRRAIRSADAGFKKAKQTVDPEKLRAWAMESIERWPPTNGLRAVPGSEIPEYLRGLYEYPPDATISSGPASEGPVVSLLWGGGFFHWGIQVGSTNFVRLPNPQYPRVFQLAPGIYYTREASWDLQ